MFSFVRHPFDRLVSAYLNKRGSFLKRNRNFKRMINQSVEKYVLAFMKNQSFPVFVDYVISEYQHYKNSKWPEIPDNQHWISLERRCW